MKVSNSSDLTKLSLAEAREGLLAKSFSSAELTNAYITAAESAQVLNCFITETFELARDMASRSDVRLARNEGGLLEGIPIGIKDLFCTRDVRTTAGSRILENFVPPYESTVTDKLWKSGAVCVGKLNLAEFAMGS